MERTELAKTSSARQDRQPLTAPRYILVATWAMSRREPHLFYWRDPNSYDNNPYIIDQTEPGQEINAAARAIVIDSLIFAGTENKRAQKAIKDVRQGGTIIIRYSYFDKATTNLVALLRKAPMVLVETIPSVLTGLKKDLHSLHPASVIQPYSRWKSSLERRVELAFQRFVAQK